MSLLLLSLSGCARLALDPAESQSFVVYDPDASEVPQPTDLLLDPESGTLALPVDDEDLPPAEIAFREWLNEGDSWPRTSTMRATIEGEVDQATLARGVLVFEWDGRQLTELDATPTLQDGALEIAPPTGGWEQGSTVVGVVRGGELGLADPAGVEVGPDLAWWYLRQDVALDDEAHQRAFPGSSREERMAVAAELEPVRQELSPLLDALADWSIARDEVSALWHFTVEADTTVAMEEDTQRVPVPFDLLVDPESGYLDLPIADDDDALRIDAKTQLNELQGFALSANLHIELTAAVDPLTATEAHLAVYELDTARPLALDGVRVMGVDGVTDCEQSPAADDCVHILIDLDPDEVPLVPGTRYAVVVREGVLDTQGDPVRAQPVGALLMNPHPLVEDGEPTVSVLDLETAERLEPMRSDLAPLLDGLGRDGLVAAWTFTTQDPVPALTDFARAAETLGLTPDPFVEWTRPGYSLLQDDALSELFPGLLNPAPAVYAYRTWGVEDFVAGTLDVPVFLDEETRRWTEDGSYQLTQIPFVAAIPEDIDPDEPLPVVIFGHAVVTDARWLMTIAGELADRGFASVAITFPYHGSRTACVDASLVAVPNFIPEELQDDFGYEDSLIWLPPCESGDDASCSPTGQCLNADGEVEDFTGFPIIDMYSASGAAFLDVHDLPYINDHFAQALVELGTLQWSLESQDWSGVFGAEVDPDRISYAGQSLGSIIGSVYVAVTPEIERAVFNVPGSDLVDLFQESEYFGPQMEAYFEEIDVDRESWEGEELLNTARWLIDSVDPHSVALELQGREALLQIDKIDDETGDLIIPNRTSENLARVSGLQVIEYPSVLHADLVVPVVGDEMLSDMADFLAGEDVE